MLSKSEIEVLRSLAQKYMAYANLPVQQEKRELWYALNRGSMQKPMVLIDQMPWNELVEDSLNCQINDPFWRSVEWNLRTKIYKWEHLPVDMVLAPYISLPRPISDNGFGVVIDCKTLETSKDSILAQMYNDTLSTEEDIERIRKTTVTWDEKRENEIREMGEMIFDGSASVRMQGKEMHLGLWDLVSQARGVTNCYLDFLDRPEFIHAIMDRLTNCVLDAIDQYNAIGGFDTAATICHCSHTFSDDLPVGIGKEYATSNEAWAFGMAQLLSSTSPEMTEEFEVPYMKKIFERFGAIYYGCCEKLDDRLDIIEKMPNIRKISCSPWSDRENFAASLPKKYIMSNKPSPALLATDTFDEQAVRDDLRRTMQAARSHNIQLEMILKDISTVKNDPARLWRWAEIAAEETANF